MKTIDITPTWESLIPYFVAVLRNPDAGLEAINAIQDELVKMARAIDKLNAQAKPNQ